MVLHHYSEQGDIKVFKPRAPIRHSDTEPLVFAIDEWHSPLYYFPRDCPRIGIWPVDSTNHQDRRAFQAATQAKMRLAIDARSEKSWREGCLYEYGFEATGFVDCHDHGVWVSREPQSPTYVKLIEDLPAACQAHGIQVEVVDSLEGFARELYDEAASRFRTTLHVSMVRLSLLPDSSWVSGGPTHAPSE